MSATTLTVTAPAKINLYLRVTGRRETGYHELDSLVVFADVADEIRITSSSEFSFDIDGPYAAGFGASDRDSGSTSENLAVRAAYACAEYFGKPLSLRLTLIKNLPLSSGIGGGSADAAGVVWGLIRFWKLTPPPLTAFMPLLLGLGADVPVCYLSHAAHMRGIGEILTPLDIPHEYPAVLVNPGVSCATPDVFRRYYELGMAFSAPSPLPAAPARPPRCRWCSACSRCVVVEDRRREQLRTRATGELTRARHARYLGRRLNTQTRGRSRWRSTSPPRILPT